MLSEDLGIAGFERQRRRLFHDRVPDTCPTGSDDCLANLIPLCSKHHHCVHEGGGKLALDPHTRNLAITLPDGIIWETGPPTARAG